MPRDATATRERLLRAGERHFARDGVAGARLRDIVREAGQSNDAAVGYHFGSREGLLGAIARRHVEAMEAERELPSGDIAAIVRQIVAPTAGLLGTESGRDFLRIMEQVAGWAGLEEGQINEVVRGSRLATQLDALEDLLVLVHGRTLAQHRIAEFALFLTASLAQRARVLEQHHRPQLSARRYVDDLVTMAVALLGAQP